MKMKRVLSVLLAVLIVASCFAATATVVASGAGTDLAATGSAYDDMQASVAASNKYGLSQTVNDGTILQAWNWSFKNIEANLETVAAQGFTTIQVSPPNEIKKATKGVKVTAGDDNGWWMFYQPVGFQINQSTDNALGTKSEFVSMCAKAHQLGLKVIVDAVINHVGTKDGTPDSDSSVMNHVNDKVKTYEPEIYNNQLFHSPWKKMTYIESNASQYDSTYDLTRNCTSGLPDLKTEDTRVQSAIYDYLEELVSAGADGFRFDAAKHIETPDDISSLKSDFWINTLQKVQKAHSDQEIYAYGEILNTCGVNRPFSMYTKLFDVTDSSSYWNIKDAATTGGGNAIPYYPNANFSSSNTVLWDESHDTYSDGATSSLTTTQRGKIWALVAGRKDISCVYFARPDDSTNTGAMNNITLGDAKMTSWSNATTKAINQFHNYFIGESEYCSSSGGNAWIERGTTGAVIVTLGGTNGRSVSLTNHKLANGTYKDSITGNTFTVSGGKISGTVGNTGVACIYENNEKPTEAPTQAPVTYVLGDIDESGTADTVDATYILRYSIGVIKTLTPLQILEGDVDGDKQVTVVDATYIQRHSIKMSTPFDIGQTKTVSGEQLPTEKPTSVAPTSVTPTSVIPTSAPTYSPDPETVTLYFSNNKFWDDVHVYMWKDGGGESTEWPGVSADFVGNNDYGEGIYSVTVDTSMYDHVIFNGGGSQTEDIDVATAAAEGFGLYCLDTQNDLGHYMVGYYPFNVPPYDPTTATTATTPTEHYDDNISFLLTDNFGWGSAYVYAWDADGNALNGEWPGASQAETVTNDYGETQFRCYVPAGAVGVILNNGNGAQTEDITDFGTYEGYWMDGSKNSLGHYKVTGWNS